MIKTTFTSVGSFLGRITAYERLFSIKPREVRVGRCTFTDVDGELVFLEGYTRPVIEVNTRGTLLIDLGAGEGTARVKLDPKKTYYMFFENPI